MIEVGSISIGGSVDTARIEQSLKRVENGLDNIRAQSNSANSSFLGLSNVMGSITKSLIAIGTVGVGAIAALASKAPALAPALARMQIGFFNLSNILGESLKPAFESIADLIDSVGSFLESHPSILTFLNATFEGPANAIKAALGDWDKLKNAVSLAGAAAGFVAGLSFGHPFLGAALGAAAGSLLTDMKGKVEEEIPTNNLNVKDAFKSSIENFDLTGPSDILNMSKEIYRTIVKIIKNVGDENNSRSDVIDIAGG